MKGEQVAKDHGPNIRDDEQYEKLREEGASKEKAARIGIRTARPRASEAARRPSMRS